jgi:hypothetical protein
LGVGPGEELGGVGEDGGDCGGRDPVVAKVDEAGFLEAGEDGLRGGLGFLGASMLEGGEVDELEMGVWNQRAWSVEGVMGWRSGLTGMKRLSLETAESTLLAPVMVMNTTSQMKRNR